jgi:flagellar assembly protein FliH
VAAQAKYLFDQDFAAGSAGAGGRPLSPSEQALRLAEAEAKGFRDGFDAAEKEIAAVAQRRAATATEQIADALDRLARGLAAAEARLEAESVELALAFARKLTPELVARQPFAEIAALAADCFKQLTHAPHVIVRVNDALHATARAQREEIARLAGFDGRLVVVAEPEIAPGDCKIEWADGGVIRDQANINRTIGDTVGRYLDALQTAATPKPGDTQ